MNRIDAAFKGLADKKEKALVGFVTAGDPDLGQSLRITAAMCAAGLDLLELGVPFSDPTADGPVIQRSSSRALSAGIGLAQVLDMVAALRRKTQVPIIVFSYYNPILAYGAAAFHRDALNAGADGVLLVDLPPEESAELTDLWPDNGLCLIRLTAPTTPPERMARITAGASGFIYHVSQLGVTGGKDCGRMTSPARCASCARPPACRSAWALASRPRPRSPQWPASPTAWSSAAPSSA